MSDIHKTHTQLAPVGSVQDPHIGLNIAAGTDTIVLSVPLGAYIPTHVIIGSGIFDRFRSVPKKRSFEVNGRQ